MIHLTGNKTFGLVFIFIFVSCTSATKISVNNVNDSGTPQTGSFVFALPLTVIDVQVTAEKVSVIPGPYYKYADKYLGIKDVPEKTEDSWYIGKMQLTSHIETDPDYIYTVKGVAKPDADPGMAKMITDGLILTAKDFSVTRINEYNLSPSMDEIIFTDLSVKRNFEADKDINISLAMPDSDGNIRPATRGGLKEKTVEQKAEEAANFLIKLRKRRFKLVSGKYDYMPQGEAMADALKELARLEDAYLSLFIGKTEKTQFIRHYSFIPVTGKVTDNVVLFRFSANDGFADFREAVGVPVVLEITDNEKTRALDQYKLHFKPDVNQLHYRIAEQVAIRLKAGELLWAEGLFPVFQYGAIIPMALGK